MNIKNTAGATALIYAVTSNREEIDALLIANKADRSIKDSRGFSSLDHAKIGRNPNLIQLLENE